MAKEGGAMTGTLHSRMAPVEFGDPQVVPAADSKRDLGRLLITCPDRPGIAFEVTKFLAQSGANIVSIDQHAVPAYGGIFAQRVNFHLPGFDEIASEFERAFRAALATRYDMDFRVSAAARPKRVAIMASRADHCLLDLLWRQRHGELDMTVTVVIANHPDLAEVVRPFGVPIPATPDTRRQAERRQLELLRSRTDLVVLARYMQIVTPDFLTSVGCPVINIHHSFLPAFVGADPYRKAKERGVKLVGATAHYVTAQLDEGPIIEQDVVRVDHTHDVKEMERRGADAERLVLSRAVRWHCQDRVVRLGNQTVVF